MIHSGPGSGAAGPVADTWSGMSGALSDIQQDISKGVTASGATWVGTAADSARGALGPLGEWAQQASTAADVMRVSVELQGDLLGKARADMPVPVTPPQQSQISQLVTSQVDFEVAEMAGQVAEQQAFQVMAQYEAATTDNVNTLGDFSEPPALVVDTAPITGVPVRRTSGIAEPSRSSSYRASWSARSGSDGVTRRSSVGEARGPSVPEEAVASPDELATTSPATPSPAAATPEVGHVADPVITTSPEAAAPSVSGVPKVSQPSGVHRVAGTPVIGEGETTPSSAEATVRSRKTSSAATFVAPTDRFSGAAVVPAARRPDQEDEPDVHESKYLLEADDIYGSGQMYSPPVIGEGRPRR